MKRLFAVMLCCTLLLGAAGALGERNEALDAAFASGGSLTLVKGEVPIAGLLSGWVPVSIAPDGETMLWRGADALYISRGFQSRRVTAAPERGVGNPYGTLEKNLAGMYRQLPAEEGVSWSPDGKYLLLTNKKRALQTMRSLDLMLVDLETGEAFLAAAFNPRFNQDDGGMVYEAKFDHTGQYAYFSGRVRSLCDTDALFRCDLNTFEVEVICENLYAVTTPGLFETAEGDWLVLTTQNNGSRFPEALCRCGTEPPNQDALALYRMMGLSAPALAAGSTVYRTLPMGMLRTERMDYSAQSGYGLMLIQSPAAAQTSALSDSANASAASRMSTASLFMKMFQLSRITPDGAEMNRFWYLIDESPDLTQVRLLEADDAVIAYAQALAGNASDETLEEKQTQLGITAVQLAQSRLFTVTALAVSPDGYYALVNAAFQGEAAFFLVRLETMEMRRVSAPEGLASNAIGTVLGQNYLPGMAWFANGTLLIYNASSRAVEAYRLDAR